MKQIIFTLAIIRKDQKILLLHRSDTGINQLPGGILVFGQEPKAMISSIVKEQLGHDSNVVQLLDTISVIDGGIQIVGIVFFMSIEGLGHHLYLGSQFDHYEWVYMSELQQKKIDNVTKETLQRYSNQSNFRGINQSYDVTSTTLDNETEVTVYTDGGSRGNPGPSAAGFVILNKNDEVLFEGGKYLGITTNNQAEYQAVKLGLEKAYELGANVVKFKMDSLLIVNQMLGVYQIKNRDLWPIYAHIKETIKKFERVTFSHVRREFNKEADALVNKVLDERR